VSTIYELDNRAAYTLTVGIAPTLNALLNWTARSVRVDNFTNQSVYLDDADSFIPGRSFGVILPIVANRAMASFKAPPFAPDPPAVAGQVCRVTFYELDLTPSPGFTPAANLDLSGADIQPVGQVAAAGSIGLAADAGHVHPGFSWLNVLNVARTPYTADPTGVLDSYATIQQALNDASPKGKVVWLPEGTFLCTVGLKIPSFVMFTGPGAVDLPIVGWLLTNAHFMLAAALVLMAPFVHRGRVRFTFQTRPAEPSPENRFTAAMRRWAPARR